MAEIKCEIIKRLGVLSSSSKGWATELNLVSWNDKPAKFDIRDWSLEHDKMGKGITLSIEEMILLKKILNELKFEEYEEFRVTRDLD